MILLRHPCCCAALRRAMKERSSTMVCINTAMRTTRTSANPRPRLSSFGIVSDLASGSAHFSENQGRNVSPRKEAQKPRGYRPD